MMFEVSQDGEQMFEYESDPELQPINNERRSSANSNTNRLKFKSDEALPPTSLRKYAPLKDYMNKMPKTFAVEEKFEEE